MLSNLRGGNVSHWVSVQNDRMTTQREIEPCTYCYPDISSLRHMIHQYCWIITAKRFSTLASMATAEILSNDD